MDSAVYPDYENIEVIKKELAEAFLTFSRNMHEYNLMTEEVQRTCTRYEWVDLLRSQAIAQNHIYRENTSLVERILKLSRIRYEADKADFSDALKYTDLEAVSKQNVTFYSFYLFHKFMNFEKQGTSMPFLWKTMFGSLLPDVEARMPHSELALMCYSIQMNVDYQIAMLGDSSVLESMQHYAQKVLEFEPRYDTFTSEVVRMRFISAYFCLLFVDFLAEGSIGFDVLLDTWQRFCAFRDSHPDAFVFKDESLQQYVTAGLRYSESFIPVLVFSFRDRVNDARKAWLREQLRDYVTHYDEPHIATYHLFAKSKMALGDWTANEAFEIADRYYKERLAHYPMQGTVHEVSMTFYVCESFMLMLNRTNYPAVVKSAGMAKAIDTILDSIRNCKNKNFGFEISHLTYDFLRDTSINGLLTPKLRRTFIMGVLKYAMVRTYAHTLMVSRLCEALLQAVIAFEPQLLIGTMGIKTVEEVCDRTVELTDYITRAARLHDVGKLSMMQIVNNNFMRLNDKEFQIIKQHPRLGLRITKVDPEYEKYSDAILRHHVWYNHQGGYPLEGTGTPTPYDFLINILQIADTLEAGSDFLGRSYKKRKTFGDLLVELKAEAGTRYNPDIVRLMSENVAVYNSIDCLLKYSMEENYYNVYLDYFDCE